MLKCCAAALCNNRSDNRLDLIFHNFLWTKSFYEAWPGTKNLPQTPHCSAVLNILVRRTTGKALQAKDVNL